MKTTSFLKCAILVAGLLAATGFQAIAQAPGGGGGGGGRGNMGVLTQEQRTKLRETIQTEAAPLMEKLAAAQKEVVTAALAENASEDTMKAKLEAVGKIQTSLALLRFKGVKAIASSLTAEQKSQLSASRDGGYMSLFGMTGGGARGARGGGGGGGNN
jgi:Spy/CpxP family protein refolding chaperone